ncbi:MULTISPECIES: RagB/SusD family nutrient uptake outer membrane protein [Bacteroides]|uniref:RagB/SusD family nutrient uptake outer membrane protein n=1 Tax=Bacteroides acidifaciens TaxID=85831 RepID=A0A4S2AMR8_9BACE|nr:RagB/SusD family nutrient uptake outer membrane protein [Bacteroides acidifaciens]TGY02281.1 RagB/SusD family nutrient uptake outer membrane protein [Bacteroides acidifaciens]
MKASIKTYVWILVAVVLTTGCSDWLDYSPKDQYVKKQQFSTVDGFYSAVNGVYNRIASNTLYGQNLSYGMIDILAQRYTPGSNNSNSLNYLWSTYDYSSTNLQASIDAIWKEAYSTILNVNVILGALEEQNGVLTQKDMELIKGDCLALRAFIHFDLLRLFGPNYNDGSAEQPAIPYNNSDKAQAHELLSSRQFIYDYLMPDLNLAEELLKEADPILTEGVLNSNNENGNNYRRYRQLRLNYFAVILMKARVHLWAKDYTNALTEAERLIGDDYVKTTFPFVDSDKLLGSISPDRVFSSEVLFGLYNADRESIYSDNFDGTNLSGAALLQPKAGYIQQLFNQADYRFLSQWRANGNLYSFCKYAKISYNEENPPFYAFLMPLMRISEAYYIAAESSIMKDPSNLMAGITAAQTYLTPIKQARGIGLPGMFELLTEHSKEYLREFWGEGQIFFMLKRNNQGLNNLYNANTDGSITATYQLPLPASEQENR